VLKLKFCGAITYVQVIFSAPKFFREPWSFQNHSTTASYHLPAIKQLDIFQKVPLEFSHQLLRPLHRRRTRSWSLLTHRDTDGFLTTAKSRVVTLRSSPFFWDVCPEPLACKSFRATRPSLKLLTQIWTGDDFIHHHEIAKKLRLKYILKLLSHLPTYLSDAWRL